MELIIAIVVMGILATFAIVGFRAVVDRSTEAKQQQRMQSLLREARTLYVQKIYQDPTYTWQKAIIDATADLPGYKTDALSSIPEGVSATGGVNLNTGSNSWTLEADTGATVYSTVSSEIVFKVSGTTLYTATLTHSTRAVFGMVSQDIKPYVWSADCAASSCDAESATTGVPAGGSYTPGTTSAPVLSISYASGVFSSSGTSETVTPLTSGSPTSYSYSGTLPAGVTFSTTTGAFTGPSSWGATVTDVTTALNRTCAIVSGAAKCWSLNTDGALGDGTTGTRLTPVQVTGLTSGVTAISTNDNTTCAVVSGAAKCWGNNTNGQIGDGTTTSRSTPTQVTGLTSGVTAISVGGQHVCAVVSGAAKCWGMNSSSQLGDGTTTSKTTPTTVSGLSSGVTQISAAALGGCVLLTSGGVKCWGDNTNGQLGDGTTTARSTPVAVSGLSSGVTQISANSDSHACAVLTGGGVKCWGGNSVGGLGDGTTTNRSTPVSVVGLGASATSVSTGLVRSCAVLTTGSVYCWGWNSTGQLGDGTTTDNPSPVQVSGITAGAVVTASAWYHSCAVVSVGLKCWGRNTIGQLGDGTTTQRLTPVRTTGLNDVAGTPVSITVTATNAGGSSSTTVTLSVS